MPTHRVLHLLSQRPGRTGSGVMLDSFVRCAADAGWEQDVVVGTPTDDPWPQVGGLETSRVHPLLFDQPPLDFPLPGMSDVMPYRSSRFSQLSTGQLKTYRESWKRHLAETIETVRPDLIHSHHIWLLSSLIKDVAPEIPVLTSCHATGLRQMRLCPHLAEEVRRGCGRNDRFTVLYYEHAEQLERDLEVGPDRIDVLGTGFREDLFHSRGRADESGLSLLYAGKLSNSKGLPWLLDAVDRLGEHMPELRLHIAGSGAGPEADALRIRIEQLAPRVIAHGQVDQAALSDLMRQADVFVLPSFYEGLPLVLVEAAACGCRLVSTELPGVVRELAPKLGDSLEMVPLPRLHSVDVPVEADLPQFVADLQAAIVRSLINKQPVEPSLIQTFSWDNVFSRLESIWLRLIERHSSHGQI